MNKAMVLDIGRQTSVAHGSVPLTVVQVGQRVRIAFIAGGERAQARLAELGLIPNVEVKVLNRSKGGPLLLIVKGSRLALGRSLSSKIMVVQ